MTWLLLIATLLTGVSLAYNGYVFCTNRWLRRLPTSWLIQVANLFVFVVLLVATVSV